MKTRKIITALACVSALCWPIGAPVAMADVPKSTIVASSLTDSEQNEIRYNLIEYGVDNDVANRLIEKYEKNQIWDSLLPGSVPIDSETTSKGGKVRTVDTYADGSISVTTVPDFHAIERANEGAAASSFRSIRGCRYRQSGATRYWTNCDGTVDLVLVSMGFGFDYQNVNHRNPQITRYGPYHHRIIGGSLSNFRFDRISRSQVRLSADFDIAFKGFPAGWTAWMQVNVTGDNAWTSHN